ncbi:hypothetical protein ACV3Z5_13770 [Clostridium perfringens]
MKSYCIPWIITFYNYKDSVFEKIKKVKTRCTLKFVERGINKEGIKYESYEITRSLDIILPILITTFDEDVINIYRNEEKPCFEIVVC